MLRLVLIVCFMLSPGLGYDFKDPYYNDFVLESYYFYQSKNLLKISVPQEGTCQRPFKYHCCDYLNEENSLQLGVAKIECFIEHVLSTSEGGIDGKKLSGPLDIFSCEKLKKFQDEFVCVSQCVARKWNMTDEDGDLFSAEAVVPVVKKIFSEQIFEDAQLEKLVNECLDYTEKHANATTEFQCNPAASSFGYCMWRKSNLECPDPKRDNSAACEQLRDQLAEAEKP